MLGKGVLYECLRDPEVSGVTAVGRASCGVTDGKLTEIVTADLFALGEGLDGFDVCLYCLGATSVGATEEAYRRVTVDLTRAVAEAMVARNPAMQFLFISGRGSDSTGTSGQMWARVKGEAENLLFAMPFASVYVFRPGAVHSVHGTEPRGGWTRAMYRVLGPLLPLFRAVAPRAVSTTEELGKAMLRVARHGFSKKILESTDFREASLLQAPVAAPAGDRARR